MAQVDFYVCPTDDFWARDNGPCFVQDDQGQWVVLDWGFNGWGGDTPFDLDDDVPIVTAEQLNLPLIDLNAVVLEGGAIEIDGQGTLMATRSSITGEDRNPGWTEAEIEDYFATYLGVEQVIWLDGQFGGNEDITDQHIDGFVKFASGNTIVTMSNPDLAYWYVDAEDRIQIAQAENTEGDALHARQFAPDPKPGANDLGDGSGIPKLLCQLLRGQCSGAGSGIQ